MAFSVAALALLLPPHSEQTLQLYERQRLTLDTVYLTDEYGGREVVPKNFQARTGSGLVLKGPQFYSYVGRDDLASEHRQLVRRKKILSGVGFSMLLAGSALALSSVFSPDQRSYSALVGSGATLVLGSLVPIGFSIALPAHPVTTAEIAELVETKNRAIRAELGIVGQF